MLDVMRYSTLLFVIDDLCCSNGDAGLRRLGYLYSVCCLFICSVYCWHEIVFVHAYLGLCVKFDLC